jgi:hypothetical protein
VDKDELRKALSSTTRKGGATTGEGGDYSKERDFTPGPFVPPAEPNDGTAALKNEIESLGKH